MGHWHNTCKLRTLMDVFPLARLSEGQWWIITHTLDAQVRTDTTSLRAGTNSLTLYPSLYEFRHSRSWRNSRPLNDTLSLAALSWLTSQKGVMTSRNECMSVMVML